VEPALHGYGFCEVITKGFASADDVKLLNEIDSSGAQRYIGIKNAVESNYSHLKQTNILHLARVCEQNLRRGVESIKVYEFGRLFSRVPQQESRYEFERDTLTLAAAGRWADNRWRKPAELEDLIFSFKGEIDALASSLSLSFSTAHSERPYLHPGIQAALKVGKIECGFFGVIHPLLQEKSELSDRMIYAEFDVEKLSKLIRERSYVQAVDLPAVWRDVTLKLPTRAFAEDAVRFIEESKPDNLIRVHIVDNFKKADEEFRRVSYRLIFQSRERTLESAEVDTQMTRVLSQLKEKHKLELAL
jgi:phenylalanyl-tRNA synthetase beta chain